MNYNIKFTPTAIEKALEKIKIRGKETYGIRFGLRAGGCNGFELLFEYADIISDKDHIFNFGGLNVYIDQKSIIYLNGTLIDYETKLLYNGFTFTIPKQKTACGCKKSIEFE